MISDTLVILVEFRWEFRLATLNTQTTAPVTVRTWKCRPCGWSAPRVITSIILISRLGLEPAFSHTTDRRSRINASVRIINLLCEVHPPHKSAMVRYDSAGAAMNKKSPTDPHVGFPEWLPERRCTSSSNRQQATAFDQFSSRSTKRCRGDGHKELCCCLKTPWSDHLGLRRFACPGAGYSQGHREGE